MCLCVHVCAWQVSVGFWTWAARPSMQTADRPRQVSLPADERIQQQTDSLHQQWYHAGERPADRCTPHPPLLLIAAYNQTILSFKLQEVRLNMLRCFLFILKCFFPHVHKTFAVFQQATLSMLTKICLSHGTIIYYSIAGKLLEFDSSCLST